jgi:uncharacterized protein YndB with AHSA1/START domain
LPEPGISDKPLCTNTAGKPIGGDKVKTKTIQQTVKLPGSPREVYELLMDSKKHESLSGERAHISRKAGGKFTAWNGHITGFNLAVKPGEKIVQAWRATGWWPDHYSVAIFAIEKAKGGLYEDKDDGIRCRPRAGQALQLRMRNGIRGKGKAARPGSLMHLPVGIGR